MNVREQLDALITYTDWLRSEWRGHLTRTPSLLGEGVGSNGDGRFATIGHTIRHVFGAELRYVDRVLGRAATDVSTVPPDQVEPLFDLGARSRAALNGLLEDLPGPSWDTVGVIGIGDFEFEGTPRKIVLHTVLHEIRHWAQLSTLTRLRGNGPGLHDFLLSPTLGGEFRKKGNGGSL